MRVKCLAQNTTQCPQPGPKPRPLDLEMSALTPTLSTKILTSYFVDCRGMKVVLSSDPAMQNPSSYSLLRYQQRMVRYGDISHTVNSPLTVNACLCWPGCTFFCVDKLKFTAVEVGKYAQFSIPNDLRLIF